MQNEPEIPKELFGNLQASDPFRVIDWDWSIGRLCVRFWTGDELVAEPVGPTEVDVTLVPQKKGVGRPSGDLSEEQGFKVTLLKNLFLYDQNQPTTSPANEPDPDVTVNFNHAVLLAADPDNMDSVKLKDPSQNPPQKDWTRDLAQKEPRESGYPGPLTYSADDGGWVTAPRSLLAAYLIAYGEEETLGKDRIWDKFDPWTPQPDFHTYEFAGETHCDPNDDPIGRSFPAVYEEHGEALARYLRALWYIKEYDTETVFKPLAR